MGPEPIDDLRSGGGGRVDNRRHLAAEALREEPGQTLGQGTNSCQESGGHEGLARVDTRMGIEYDGGLVANWEMTMIEIGELKERLKQIIHEATKLDPASIADDAAFVQDLNLDSLILLEIAVNVDQEFELDLPDEDMMKFTSVDTSAQLVLEKLTDKEKLAASDG